MKKPIVFITGVNGFMGQAIAKATIKAGYDVHGLTQPGSKSKNKKVKTYSGDLLDYKAMGDILTKVNPEFIIHLAARTEVSKSFYEPSSFAEVNYVGTVNLLENASRLLPDLKLFIFNSTMETYGWQPKSNWKPFTEETEQFPNAPYAVAKVACEYYLEYLGRTQNFPYTTLRPTNAYGREDNEFFVTEQMITQMLRNKKEVRFGYREPYRNLIYIDDLVGLYLKILRNVDLANGEVFCTGPDNAIQISDLADKIAKKLKWKGKIVWGTKPNLFLIS